MRGGGAGSDAPNGNGHWVDAKDWPSNYSSPWFISDTPSVGSAAVFRGKNHVGVVEAINDNGTLVISQFNGGPGSDYYLCALDPIPDADPSNFIFLNNTTNPVICEQQTGLAPTTSASSAGGSV